MEINLFWINDTFIQQGVILHGHMDMLYHKICGDLHNQVGHGNSQITNGKHTIKAIILQSEYSILDLMWQAESSQSQWIPLFAL